MRNYKPILNHSDIKMLVNLIESNNEYNEPEEQAEWKEIVKKLKQSEEI
jgi:hypothetical protein